MTEALAVETPDEIQFSNVTAVRDLDGRLSVYVGQHKMLGAVNVSLDGSNGVLGLVVPLSRVRFAEQKPLPPVVESKVDNVVQGNFTKFRTVQAASDSTTVIPPA